MNGNSMDLLTYTPKTNLMPEILMTRVSSQAATFALLTLVAVVCLSPYAVQAEEVSSTEVSSSKVVLGRSLSKFVIGEEKVGKKVFTTSTVIVEASPARVWNVLTDYNGAAGIFSNLSKSKLISSSGSTKLVAFTTRSLGNLFKFEYTLTVTEKEQELIEWKRVRGAFQANEGYWKLQPLKDGQATLVTYAKHVDGGFLYPQVLMKKLVRESIPSIFMELKSAAESQHLATGAP